MGGHIVLCERQDPRVDQFIHYLLNTPVFRAHGAILFGGDRFACVEVVAIAGHTAGMATLAPHDEEGQGGPRIIALFIDPEIGATERRTLGGELLLALCRESEQRYGALPRLILVTETERQAALECRARGVPGGSGMARLCGTGEEAVWEW